MIAGFVMYASLVAAVCAAAAWLAERACANLGVARRWPWALGMIVSVAIPLASLALPEISAGEAGGVAAGTAAGGIPAATAALPFTIHLAELPAWPALDTGLVAGWILLSTLMLGLYLVSAWRLERRARHWPRARVAGGAVWVSNDLGPAVFGLIRGRVILPRWLLDDAPDATLRLALAHERQHILARDPALHAAALALTIIFPWNLALLWQLQRLRFALEVDCDARVLSHGTDPADYGEALLAVSQRENQAPAGAIALIERASQLERRIDIMTRTPHRRAWLAAASLVIAAACVLGAAAIEAPSSAHAPLKPAPTGGNALKLGRHFEEMLLTRYPDLLEQDRSGTAAVVVLLNEDWSIAKAAQVNFEESLEKLELKEGVFGILGIAEDAVPYVGHMGIQSPHNPAHRVLVVFTERSTPGEGFVSRVAMDYRSEDRAIFQHYFPEASSKGTPAGQGFWVLVDRGGQVLRSGQEPFETSGWNRALEARFPGIRTQEVTLTPITDAAGEPLKDSGGKDLQLYSVWLAPGSPPPAR